MRVIESELEVQIAKVQLSLTLESCAPLLRSRTRVGPSVYAQHLMSVFVRACECLQKFSALYVRDKRWKIDLATSCIAAQRLNYRSPDAKIDRRINAQLVSASVRRDHGRRSRSTVYICAFAS